MATRDRVPQRGWLLSWRLGRDGSCAVAVDGNSANACLRIDMLVPRMASGMSVPGADAALVAVAEYRPNMVSARMSETRRARWRLPRQIRGKQVPTWHPWLPKHPHLVVRFTATSKPWINSSNARPPAGTDRRKLQLPTADKRSKATSWLAYKT